MPHRTPATVVKRRGPRRSIRKPCAGCTQVWNRMKSVNAHWISDSFQPVPTRIGSTNSVHAYCRFAIMIIAITDATSWNQRLCIFTISSAPLSVRPSTRARADPEALEGSRDGRVVHGLSGVHQVFIGGQRQEIGE